MKQTNFYTIFSAVALAISLASCGGGGDAEAGSPSVFGVQPDDYTLTGCGPGYMGEVVIVGGAAPYRLINTFPDLILLHKSFTDTTPVTTVADRNGTFSVSFKGGCFDPGLVVVLDKLDHQVGLTLHNKPGTATASAIGAGI